MEKMKIGTLRSLRGCIRKKNMLLLLLNLSMLLERDLKLLSENSNSSLAKVKKREKKEKL